MLVDPAFPNATAADMLMLYDELNAPRPVNFFDGPFDPYREAVTLFRKIWGRKNE